MATDLELIKKIDFFEELDDKIIKKIAEVCIPREYSTGDYIVRQGETGLGLFFITSGKVKVEADHNGAKVVVAQLNAEDFFGELSIIDNKPRSASIICLENTNCLLLTRDSFSKLMNKYPEIAIQMAKSLTARLRATTEKVGAAAPTAVSQPAAGASGTQAGTASDPLPAPPPSSTEAAPLPPATNGASTKDKVKDFLVSTFSRLYTVKAMTRFSVAIVGCPVQVRAERESSQTAYGAVGEVKLVLFPASRRRAIRLEATGDGNFSATLLRPLRQKAQRGFSVFSLGGNIRRGERLTFYIPAEHDGPVRLEREKN